MNVDIDEIHFRFMNGESYKQIAKVYGLTEKHISNLVGRQREKDPEKWPIRLGPRQHLFHVYECEECVLIFAVEQECEDQSDVCCPICWQDNHLKDVASGVMKFKK